MEQGLIHIYCGDGKGKTSAAIGLAVRAAGSGLKVLFTRFLKNESSGELAILAAINSSITSTSYLPVRISSSIALQSCK